ncbi:MAG: 3-coathanger stack domain-containing protein [Emticicia sp.]
MGNVNREYKASKALILNSGFEVETGSVFKTILDYGCQY